MPDSPVTYTAANGTTFADDDIERWAAEAESDEDYSGGHPGPVVSGRPISVSIIRLRLPT